MSAYSLSVSRRLSTAEVRREELLEAAMPHFAHGGLHGTPTTKVAAAAGISQAYLFRLFPTKTALFVALVERCYDRTAQTFSAAARAARAEGEEDLLRAMGRAYQELLADRELLLAQLQGYGAAIDEPAVQDAVRRGFGGLFDLVRRESGGTDEELREFFAKGMLMNVLAAMDTNEVDEPWARALAVPDDEDGLPC